MTPLWYDHASEQEQERKSCVRELRGIALGLVLGLLCWGVIFGIIVAAVRLWRHL